MAVQIEAIRNNATFIRSLNQSFQDGYYTLKPDLTDCMLEASTTIVLQANHLTNSSHAIAEDAQKLLNSLSAERK